MRLVLVIPVLALFSVCHAQRFRFTPVPQSTILEREQNAPTGQEDREARIKQLFTQAGCIRDELSEQRVESVAGANVICRLPGKSKETIIVGANYGRAAPDTWSSASLLPSLFQTLVSRKRRHTFVFVAFADGNADLTGSRFFAEQMSPGDMGRTEAMVNLDALGLSPTKISSSVSDKKLVESFIIVMYALKQMGSQVELSRGVHLDSEPFASLHIPQITIHSLTQEAVASFQTPGSAPVDAEFRPDHYYNSYRLISGYLAYLDETLKRRPQEKQKPKRPDTVQP